MKMKKKIALALTAVMAVSSFAACSTGTTDTDADVSSDVSASVSSDVDTDTDVAETVYATMNIPYNDFYAAELTDNDVPVDATTSATPKKWSMFAGTYFGADGEGGKIYGPQYPVKMSQELFDELSALGEGEDYFVTALDAQPVSYKEVTADDSGALIFSEMIGGTDIVVEAPVSMKYPSNYGDFELSIDSEELPEMEDATYGVKIVTDSGKSYGLRSLENIWFHTGELSWGLGFTEKISKGNTISSAHYADMQGSTITEVIYYVADGTITVPMDLYVPVYFTDKLISAGEVSGSYGYVALTDESATLNYKEGVVIPEDYEMVFTAKNAKGEPVEGITVSDDFATVGWTDDIAVGAYTLDVSDASGKYMSYSCKVIIQTEVQPVSFDDATLSFVADNGASDETVAAYLAGIANYTVTKEGDEKGTDYSVNGHHGSGGVPMLTEDGLLDTAAVNEDGEAVYEAGETYTVTFTVTGYTAFSFTFTA